MLECKNLSVRYGRNTVLSEVSLKAEAGSVTVILGPNGSGKTTLLRTLSGVQEKYTGTLFADGNEMKSLVPSERARRISLLPQFLPRPSVTVEELAACGRYPYLKPFGKMTEEDRKQVEKALNETGLTDRRERMVCHLSGGERQLAYTAMLLAQDTDNVLFDEPTASLDTAYRQQTVERIRKLRADGKCVILSLHDLTDAIALADRILVLQKGRTVFTGNTETFIENGVPERVFGMKCHVFHEGEKDYRIFIPLEKEK